MPPQTSSASSSHSSSDVSQHAGLNNLGNTCFLNSILQPLSATRLLHYLIFPAGDLALPGHSSNPAASGWSLSHHGPDRLDRRKVPALLLSDEEQRIPIDPPLTDHQADELVRLLPLSNVFRQLLQKTWKPLPLAAGPSSKRVPSISPSELLRLLAAKFDQYSYKEQQDAHELLRLLLDAMRMEEVDFMKRMQPPRPIQGSAASSSVDSLTEGSLTTSASVTDSDHSPSTRSPNPPAEEAKSSSSRKAPDHPTDSQDDQTPTISNLPTPSLTSPSQNPTDTSVHPSDQWSHMSSLIDVVWSGRLASMVICEGCRHVSHNYEDFLDISLPLRPEDALTGGAHRRHRMRFMPDRWKRTSSANPSAPNARPATASAARHDILKGTLEGGVESIAAVDTNGGATPTEAKHAKSPKKGTSDDREGTAAAQTSSGSWTAWAASLGRSKPARPSSRKDIRPPATPETTIEAETTDIPDLDPLLLSPRPATTQPLPETTTEYTSVNGLNATLEAKTRGSRDLLTALSNASRASSRAGSRTRAGSGGSRGGSPSNERSHSPSVINAAKDSDLATSSRSHTSEHLLHPSVHHANLQSFMPGPSPSRQHSTAIPKEPSNQARYIVRVFSEASDACNVTTSSPFPSGSFRSQVREAQAKTGLVTAIRAFTSSEVLADENAFHCRRCWRRLNPAQGDERERLRRHRIRKGKDASGSEDSEDDEDDEETRSALPHRTNLVAPQPKRAVDGLLRSRGADEGETDDADESSDDDSEPMVAKTQIVVDPPETHLTSATVELLEEGARTPVSRVASAQGLREQEMSATQAGPEQINSGSLDSAIHPAEPGGTIATIGSSSSSSLEDAVAVPPSKEELPSTQGEAEPQIDAALPPAVALQTKFNGGSADADTPKPSEASAITGTSDEAMTGPKSIKASRPATVQRPMAFQKQSHKSSKMKRSAQSIPRRALKRYLISEFPAVIPFHLKRFHAEGSAGKSSLFSSTFSSSLKKIDDLVTYPLYLDMAEWMAPPREDYDRHGRLKATSHPDAWKAHRSEAEGETTAASTDYLPSEVSTSEGGDLKRKGSMWHRPFSRNENGNGHHRGRKDDKSLSHALQQCGMQSTRGPSPLYRLYAVTNHQGASTTSGHYTTYILSDRVTGGRMPRPDSNNSSSASKATMQDDKKVALSATDSNERETSSSSSSTGLDSTPHTDASGSVTDGRSSSSAGSEREKATAFDPTMETRSWVWCSDTEVRPVSEEAVLKNKDAYILWYERVE